MEVGRRVGAQDIRHVIKLACRIQVPASQQLLDVKLLCILVDGVETERPVGVDCRRLEAYAEIVIAPVGEVC